MDFLIFWWMPDIFLWFLWFASLVPFSSSFLPLLFSSFPFSLFLPAFLFFFPSFSLPFFFFLLFSASLPIFWLHPGHLWWLRKSRQTLNLLDQLSQAIFPRCCLFWKPLTQTTTAERCSCLQFYCICVAWHNQIISRGKCTQEWME